MFMYMDWERGKREGIDRLHVNYAFCAAPDSVCVAAFESPPWKVTVCFELRRATGSVAACERWQLALQ